MAQYLVLIYQDENQLEDTRPDTPMASAHLDFAKAQHKSLVGGNALERSADATSIRPDGAGGFIITDGPFAETKEQLGGYYLIEAPDLDAAITVAKQVPLIATGGVEVRPIRVFAPQP
jgi:hypothetical protein